MQLIKLIFWVIMCLIWAWDGCSAIDVMPRDSGLLISVGCAFTVAFIDAFQNAINAIAKLFRQGHSE